MGETPEGAGGEGGLTPEQRQNLIEAVYELLDRTKTRTADQGDAARMVDLVEIALRPLILSSRGDGLQDFGVTDAAAFDELSAKIRGAVKALLLAAKEVEALMLDEGDAGFDALAASYPWLENIAQFDGVVGEFLSGGDMPPTPIIRKAVAMLLSLEERTDTAAGRRGRPPREGVMTQIVRAVCVFCHESPHLRFQRSWPTAGEGSPNTGRRGGKATPLTDEQIGLPTQTAELIDLVVRIVCPDARRNEMRSQLLRFVGELSGRAPRESDLIRWTVKEQGTE